MQKGLYWATQRRHGLHKTLHPSLLAISTALKQSLPPEQLLWATQVQRWATKSHWHGCEITGGVGSLCCTRTASALGQQQWQQTDAVTTLQQGGWVSLLFCRAWLLRASRSGHLIQEISWEELSCDMHFCTSSTGICTGILVLPMLVGQLLLRFVMPSKLNFWLLKVFLKSPFEFSDNIFHYLIKAKITAKNVLNVKRPGMLTVSASMLQEQGAATSLRQPLHLKRKYAWTPSLCHWIKGFKEVLTMNCCLLEEPSKSSSL